MLERSKISLPKILAILLLGISSCLLFQFTIGKAPTLGYDQSFRSFEGLKIHYDVTHGDVSGFFHHTDRQRFWPFLYSWFLAGFYLLLGPSVLTTRIAALSAFVACGWAAMRSAQESDAERSAWTGLLCLWIFLLMKLLVAHAAVPMLEIPGILTALLFLRTLNDLIAHPCRKNAVRAAFYLGIQVYLKYNYAFFSLLAGLLILAPIVWRNRGLIRGRLIALFAGTYFLMVAAWIGPTFKRKIEAITEFGVSVRYVDAPFWSWRYLGYYLERFFDGYAVTSWLGAVLLVGLIAAFFHWKNRPFRSYLIYGVVTFIMVTLHPQKAPRFGASFVGMLPIFASVVIVDLLRIIGRKTPRVSRLVLPVACGLLLLVTGREYWNLYRARNCYPADRSIVGVLDAVSRAASGTNRVWVCGAFEEVSQPMINFSVMTELGRPVNIKSRDSLWVDHAASLGVPGDRTTQTLKESVGDLRKAMAERRFDRLISIVVHPDSRFNKPSCFAHYSLCQSYRPFLETQTHYREETREYCSDAGITVVSYSPGVPGRENASRQETAR